MRETKWWTWHMAAGATMFLLLGAHMATMHTGGLTGLFVSHPGEAPTALVNSQARDASFPLTVAYVLLLGAGLFHGLYGLRTILFELTLRPATEKVVTVVLFVVGAGLFALGAGANLAAHASAIALGG